MKEVIAIGDTVEIAKEKACEELGVESYEAQFEILEMPTRKTLGIFGGNPAKVRVYIEDDPAQKAAEYLKKVIHFMGLSNVEINIDKDEKSAMLNLTGNDIGFVIGHRGETLDALQYLSGLVANHGGGPYYRITLDIGNYREKRKQTLETLGIRLARKAVKTGRNCVLEPMNPYERRIIHTVVQTVDSARSWSEGEDLNRHVVIGSTNERFPQRGSYKRPAARPANNIPRGR